MSSPTLRQLAHQLQHGKGLGQFCSHNPGARLIGTHITRPSSTVSPSQGAGPTLLCTAVSEEQEKLFCSPDPEVSPPVCRTGKGGGHLSLTQTTTWQTCRTGSPVPLPTESALWCCQVKVQDTSSWVLQLVRDQACSPTLLTKGLAFLPTSRWGGARKASQPTPAHVCQTVGSLSCSHPFRAGSGF